MEFSIFFPSNERFFQAYCEFQRESYNWMVRCRQLLIAAKFFRPMHLIVFINVSTTSMSLKNFLPTSTIKTDHRQILAVDQKLGISNIYGMFSKRRWVSVNVKLP